MLADAMTERMQFMDTKEALFLGNAMGTESLKNCLQVLEVLFLSGTGNENVINVDVR